MPADTLAPPAPPAGSVTPTPNVDITPRGDPTQPVQIEQPAPGSAKSRAIEHLSKYIKKGSAIPEPPPEVTADKPAAETPPKVEGTETPPEAGKTAEGTATPPAAADGKKPKVSPWKLVDEYKAKYAEAEQKIVELQKGTVAPAQVQELQTRLQQLEQRAQAAEEELRFANYQKHPEFKEKYELPYERQYAKAVKELRGVAVRDMSTGAERPFAVDDLQAIVSLELGPARKLANEMFGDFAGDAMNHRQKILDLFEAKETALKEAREKGGEREKQMRERFQAFQAGLNNQITQMWDSFNAEAPKDPVFGKWLSPVEGDTEINERLAKGYEIVDSTLKVDPKNPRLTPEQRAKAIKAYTALRNRAAAFGRLTVEVSRKDAKIAELQKKLDAYKGSQPGTGGGKQASTTPAPTATGRQAIIERLAKIAH